PAGVAIVGVDLEGERLGLTIGTLIPLSLEPPLVGFAVRREAALHELLRRSGEFGVSLLAAGQEGVAQHFARGVPPIAIWEGIDVRAGEGPPLVAGAIGWLTVFRPRCRRARTRSSWARYCRSRRERANGRSSTSTVTTSARDRSGRF